MITHLVCYQTTSESSRPKRNSKFIEFLWFLLSVLCRLFSKEHCSLQPLSATNKTSSQRRRLKKEKSAGAGGGFFCCCCCFILFELTLQLKPRPLALKAIPLMACFAALACSGDLAALILAARWEIPTDSRFPKTGGVEQFHQKGQTESPQPSTRLALAKSCNTCISCSRASSRRDDSYMIGNECFSKNFLGVSVNPIPFRTLENPRRWLIKRVIKITGPDLWEGENGF